MKASIDQQGRMLAPATDRLSEGKIRSVSYAEAKAAAGDLCGIFQLQVCLRQADPLFTRLICW